MVAITLIQGVNDSPEDAAKVADFVLPMLAGGVSKVVVDLIPYNDIKVLPGYAAPHKAAVDAFQKVSVSAAAAECLC